MPEWLWTPILWWHFVALWGVQILLTLAPKLIRRLFETKEQRAARALRIYAETLIRG